MNRKKKVKSLVDAVMTILLFLLMAYHVTGNRLHEWLGVVLGLLFILHHFLNIGWYRAVMKGKHTAVQKIWFIHNFLLMAAMAGMIASGILISRDVFRFPDIGAGRFGRRLHMASSAWGFVLISIHMGFHFGSVAIRIKRTFSKERIDKLLYLCKAASIALSVYGVCAFGFRQTAAEMFLLTDYPFFSYGESSFLFFADYASIMILFACTGYYGMKALQGRGRK